MNESLRGKSTALPSALHKAGAAFFYERRSNANSAFFQGLSQLSQQRETIQVTPISCLSLFPLSLPLAGGRVGRKAALGGDISHHKTAINYYLFLKTET